MYSVYVDGQMLFSSAAVDEDHIILSPKLTLDVNGAGSLSFVLPPGNALYDSIHRLKSIITVKQDDDVIFRGRVLDDEKDFYNQKDVYCEGDRSFLLDSLCAPYAYNGTVLGLFQKLIDEHNAQVDSEKQFTVGNVTAVSSSETLEVENVAYYETLKEFDEKLLSVYGGYLMTRTEGGITYVDWLAKSGDTSEQVIEFSVNLLDIKDKVDASDVFTCLIPLGASEMGDDGEYSEPVNIASVNNGLKYIQDDEAVARYGKIWRTRTWNYEKDPAKLLAKGQEYMKTGIALQTLTLNVIDMHFINGDAQAIRIGAYVRILSNPHGLDITMNCTKMDIDLLNPENTPYTFGEPPRTLTENVVKTEEDLGELTGSYGGGGGRSVKQEMKDYIRWAEIKANADEAMIELLTGEVQKTGERLSKAEVTLDGVNAQILLKADVATVDELANRMTDAEIEIDGMNAEIVMKASQTTVDALGERVSSAEIRIDGAESEILLKANKVYVDAQITEVKTLIAEEIEAAKGEIENAYLATLSTNELFALEFVFAGDNVSKTTIPVVTGISGGVASSTDVTFLTTDVGNSYTVEAGTADPVYSDGVHAKFVQGPEYTGTLYQPGQSRTIVSAGNRFDTALYYGGSSKSVTKQGTRFDTALFYGGSSTTVTKQGSKCTTTLYKAGSSKTYNLRGSSTDYNLYRTSSVSVKVQGSEYTSTVYTKSGSTYTMVTIPLFREGSSKTYYNRTLYASAGDLYEDGGSTTVTLQGSQYTTALYNAGSSLTYTAQGSEYTGTLYEPGSSFTYTAQGEEYTGTLYEPGGSTTITEQGEMYTGALFTQGTEYSGGLYTNFEPATLTIQEITALTA